MPGKQVKIVFWFVCSVVDSCWKKKIKIVGQEAFQKSTMILEDCLLTFNQG